MSVEEKNKEVARRVTEEVFNGKNMSVLDKLVSPDYVYHGAFGDFRGCEGLKEIITAYYRAFPDIHATIDQMVAEGDTVAYCLTVRCTFRGKMMGITPTGRQLNITEGVFIRFEDGKEAETFPFSDGITFFQQLRIPFPEQ